MKKLLTTNNITAMARTWFRKFDVHAPVAEFLPMLAKQGIVMKFPEGTLHGRAGFKKWYQGVIRIFFDQKHTIRRIKTVINSDRATVNVVVRWTASRWSPPAAYSEHIAIDAHQTWVLGVSKTTGRPEILTYIVDKMVYIKGSAKL